jgi:hypothetical protein
MCVVVLLHGLVLFFFILVAQYFQVISAINLKLVD